MANQFNIIKKKTIEIFGKRITEEAEMLTDQIMADILNRELGEYIDTLVDMMIREIPEASIYRYSIKREVIKEFVNMAKTGIEPNLERAVRRAIEGNDDNTNQQRQNRDFVGRTRRTLTTEQIKNLEHTIAQCAGFVKMMCGVSVNCALLITKDALDKIADVRAQSDYEMTPWHPHPNYKTYRVKGLFNQFEKEKRSYFSHLLCPPTGGVRFFDLKDMPEEARRKYKTMTNREYFEFWKSTGAHAYLKSQPLIGSLHNKFRVSLLNHGVPYPELVAWGLVGASVLELAQETWQRAMRSVQEACDNLLILQDIERIYKPFSPQRMSIAWQCALKYLSPEADTYKLDDQETRNIALGLDQLRELWISTDLPFDATIQAVDDYSDDIFATKGYAKKAMRELAEMREDAIRDLEEQRKLCPTDNGQTN